MDADRLLSIFELLLRKDEREAEAAERSACEAVARGQQSNACWLDQEAAVVGHAIAQGDDDGCGAPATIRPYPVVINSPIGTCVGPPNAPGIFPDNPNAPKVVEKVVSPELGTAIPLEWLDPVDVLFDKLKDDAEATKSLDAMILNWLRIARWEPEPGEDFDGYRMQADGGQIGFLVEACLKRGYKYHGKAAAPHDYWGRGFTFGILRKPLIKIKDGVSPPPPKPVPAQAEQAAPL